MRAAHDLSWRPLASTPPFDDALRNRQRSSAPGPLRAPELTGAPSAFGLPAEGSWLDDDYDRHALVPAEPGSARADSNDLPALIPLDVRVAPPKRRRSTVRRVLGTLLLGCAFTLGGWVAYSGQGLELPRTPRALARVVSGPHRPKVTATAHRRVAPPSLERHGEREPVPLLENRPPDPGTLDDTRQRKDPHQEPAQLSRRATQKKLFEFVENPSTTVGALTLLAQVATPKSLDILYQVWTGSKGRTDATRLAQTLLLGEEVRSHAAPALEVALALRERPTDCGQVRRLVDAALAHGDQRSAMLLVRTAERKDCKEGRLTTQCAMCLGKPNKIRTAIRVTARRR